MSMHTRRAKRTWQHTIIFTSGQQLVNKRSRSQHPKAQNESKLKYAQVLRSNSVMLFCSKMMMEESLGASLREVYFRGSSQCVAYAALPKGGVGVRGGGMCVCVCDGT